MDRRAGQRGLSMIGFLFVAVVIVVCVMLGFRVTPSYIEYYSVEKALARALNETKDLNSPSEIRKSFQKFADAGYIESVTEKDVEIVKTKNEITASASWTRKLPLVGNASLLLDFEASATRCSIPPVAVAIGRGRRPSRLLTNSDSYSAGRSLFARR